MTSMPSGAQLEGVLGHRLGADGVDEVGAGRAAGRPGVGLGDEEDALGSRRRQLLGDGAHLVGATAAVRADRVGPVGDERRDGGGRG